jgi:tripeptide aminopeptidase
MGKAIDYFNTAAAKFVEDGPKTTYNVGRIGGGTSVNSIPFETWMEVDMRSLSPEKLKGIEQILLNQVNKALDDYNSGIKTGAKLTVQFEKIGERPSGVQKEDLPLIQRAIAAIEYFKLKTLIRYRVYKFKYPNFDWDTEYYDWQRRKRRKRSFSG